MGQAIDDTGADRISDGREHDWQSAADMLQRCHSQGATGQDDVRGERDQFGSMFYALVGIVLAPAVSIRTFRPTPQPNSCRPWWNAASRS